MPRSVYVVKGEGVRDNVWTPKTGLAPSSLADHPELVKTVPSPNCSVNPVVQVFLRAPTAAPRLAENVSALCIPNNAVTTADVAPLRSSTSSALNVGPNLANKQYNAPASQVLPETVSNAPSRVQDVSNNPSSAASRQNNRMRLTSPQTWGAGGSTLPPFRAYNCSPMVSTVLQKQMKSGKTRSGAPSSQINRTSLNRTSNRSHQESVALQGQGRKNTSVDSPGARGRAAQQPLPAGTNRASVAIQREHPKSPSSSAKPSRVPEKLSATDEAFDKEKRRVMGDMVERRIAHHREKSAEKSAVRSLTPINRLIEDSSIQKLSRKSTEAAPESGSKGTAGNGGNKEDVPRRVPHQCGASQPTSAEATESRNLLRKEKTVPEMLARDTVTPAKGNVSALVEDRPLAEASQKDKPNGGSTSEHKPNGGSTSEHKPNYQRSPPRNSPSKKMDVNREVQLSAMRVENPRVEAPVVTNRDTGKIERPSRFSDNVRRIVSKERTHVNGSSPFSSTRSVERGVERAREESLREVEDQYLALTRSIFALTIQARQEGRNKEGFSGNELRDHMKKRVLAAFVTPVGEPTSVLNQKALRLLSQFKLSTTDTTKLRLKGREVNIYSYPVRLSKKDNIRPEHIRGLKFMLLSWEGFRGSQKANTHQFHMDTVHLKCIAEALQEGKHVSLSNDEAFLRFKELVLVHVGMELIFDTISELKTRYKNGDRECVRPWFRSTECILVWYNYMRSRMEQLLTVADEPFASELRAYCKEFTKGLIDQPDDSAQTPERGEGVRIGGKLRELKKLIISLGEYGTGDKYCERTTAHLTPVTRSFAKLLRLMLQISALSRSTGERRAQGTGGQEGSPEPKGSRRHSSEAGDQKRGSVAPRQTEPRAKRDDARGSSNKGVDAKKAVTSSGGNQEDPRPRVMNNTRSITDGIRKKGTVDERRGSQERGRGNGGVAAKDLNSFPSIPRRPVKADGVGNSGRAGVIRSSGAEAMGTRAADKSGPAATVQRMLASAAAPTAEKVRKRKRGESILQDRGNDALDEKGMRADRRKKSRIRFRVKPDVDEKLPPADKESLRTLFSDGESWMLSGNAVQKAAIEERNARLSRETVDIWFSFVRMFVWRHKCMKDGRPFVMPRFLPNPSTPSAIRDLSRRITALRAPASSRPACDDDVSARRRSAE
eukprot:TRINITY_DN262_c0_g1_i1.p1 TRINITY_DN262_c0_g1~~TRINITY_DN262_c0_g1_i1.p1  ORF type:complete len:1171 (+),score=157.83 TRINITY_DN262_c0_g1_i1:424-3936(+)